MFKIGTVTKYLEKTGVCIVDLIADLGVSDKIRIMHKYKDTIENIKIEFIQIGTQKVEIASKGTTAIVKFDQAVREGSEIYRNG